MKKLFLSCVVSLCVTAAVTQPASAAEISTVDAWTCADWAKRAEGISPLEHHLTGLINGMSVGANLNLWGLPTKIEREQLFYWMDQYCAKNPLNLVIQGAGSFAIERQGTAWADSFK
jgi:hypothetical protein